MWFVELLYAAGVVIVVSYALLSLNIDGGNTLEIDWYSKSRNEYLLHHQATPAIHSRISFNWNHQARVGEILKIVIRLFKNSPKGTVAYYPTELDTISLEIVSITSESVSCTRENSEKISNQVIYSFSVSKAGFYDVYAYINEEKLYNSPISKYFLPEIEMDLEKTCICTGFAPAVCVSGKTACRFVVKPKDRFGNACCQENIDPLQFSWTLEKEARDGFWQTIPFKNYIHSRILILNEVIVSFLIYEPGIFQGKLLYKDKLLANGNFQVVCVTEDEDSIFNTIVEHDFPTIIKYNAKLLENVDFKSVIDGLKDPFKKRTSYYKLEFLRQDVTLYLTPSMVYVTEKQSHCNASSHSHKILCSIKIGCDCKIQTFFVHPKTQLATFEVTYNEEYSIQLEMSIQQLRIFMAVFSKNIFRRKYGEDNFIRRRQQFTNKICFNKHKVTSTEIFEISRKKLFAETSEQTKKFQGPDWKKKFIIKFCGENLSFDAARREYYSQLFLEIFHPEKSIHGMFVSVGENNLIHPNPNNIRAHNPEEWKIMWNLLGKIVGKCIYETAKGGLAMQHINARFTRSFLAQIIGLQPNYTHFEKDDPQLFRETIREILQNDVTNMNLHFIDFNSSQQKQNSNVELIPNGSRIPVTNENKVRYINSLAKWRLRDKMKLEINWFLEGLQDIIPLEFFRIFDENELELLICGGDAYIIEDLLGEECFKGRSAVEQKILSWFTQAVADMSYENKGRFLQFITGSSKLHSGLSDSSDSQFRVRFLPHNFGDLPRANIDHPNTLYLPHHPNYDRFQKSMLVAINGGSTVLQCECAIK